jgi:ABC-type uncharacterized transport system auxiliary subunit
MNRPHACVLLLSALAAIPSPGCALLSKGEQGAARFFSLERAVERPGAVPAEVSMAQDNPVELRLGRVTGAHHLDVRLVFRASAYEIRYYRELRWTEPPELCLERSLARALFERRKLQHVVGGIGPTLDVQLTVFDEIIAPKHLVRVQVVARLHDEHLALWEETLTVDRPVVEKQEGDPALAIVDAFSDALAAAVDLVADRVVSELGKTRPASHESPRGQARRTVPVQKTVPSSNEKLWEKPTGARPKP